MKSRRNHAELTLVDELAALGRPSMTTQGGRLQVPMLHGIQGQMSQQATVALLAWMHRDALVVAFDRELQRRSDPGALPAAERAKRIRELEDDVDRLERQEEWLIEDAAAQGIDVPRRRRSPRRARRAGRRPSVGQGGVSAARCEAEPRRATRSPGFLPGRTTAQVSATTAQSPRPGAGLRRGGRFPRKISPND